MDLSSPRWCYLRDYHKENYQFEKGIMKLKGTKVTLEKADSPTFIGIRQSEFHTYLKVTVGGSAEESGITFYMDEDQHYDLAVIRKGSRAKAVFRIKVGDAQTIVKELELPDEGNEVFLEADSTPSQYDFYIRQDQKRVFLGSARTKYLSSEVAGGFTGVVMGLYAIDENGNQAEFKDLSWKQE